MKNIYIILILFFSQISIAQNTSSISGSGIYMNWQDYKNDNLSYIINCDSSSGKIRLNHFLSKNYIEVIQEEKKTRLSKDSIFGYRDCKQNDYRFFKNNDEEFLIKENKAIVIYISDVPVTTSTGKAINLVPRYFFSAGLNSEIFPLTIINLKKAFPDNLKFHDMLDLEFNSIKDISAYDEIHKMYKVNFLLTQSNKSIKL
ncbi:MAG: hypothetical protein ACXVPY_05530 [Bacteroidia bacterium]